MSSIIDKLKSAAVEQKARELTGQEEFQERSNRLRDSLLQTESRNARLSRLFYTKTLKNRRLWMLTAVLGAAAAIGVSSALMQSGRVATLSMENKRLSEKVLTLESSVKALEVRGNELQASVTAMETELGPLQDQNLSLQQQLEKSRAEIDSMIEERSYLEDILIHKTKEIEKLGSAAPVAGEAPADQKAEIDRLRAQNATLASRLDRLYQLTSDRLSTLNVARITLESALADARKVIEDEWSTVDLGAIRVEAAATAPAPSVRQEPAPASPAPAAPPQAQRSAPRSEGRIRAINDAHGFVVIDLGKVDNVKLNSKLEVLQAGKVVAQLSILEIRDVMSACNIQEVEKGKKISVNDQVKLKK